MDKKIKSISVLASIVAVAGIFVFAHGIPYVQVQGFSSMEILDLHDISQDAELVVMGIVMDSKTVAMDHDNYHGVQITQLKITEVIKGSVDSRFIEIRDFASDAVVVKNGLRYELLESPFVPKYEEKEAVLLFLSYDEGNVLGDAYYVLSGSYGKFQVEDGQAINADSERTQSTQQIKQRISSLS